MLPKEILHDPRFHFDTNAEKHLRDKLFGTFLFRACEDNNYIVLCYFVPDRVLGNSRKVIRRHKYQVIVGNEKLKIVSTGKKNKTYQNLDKIIASINTRKIKLVTPLFIEELFPVQIPLPPEIVKRADFHPNVNAEESLKNSTEPNYLFKKCRIPGYIVLVLTKNRVSHYYYFRWANKTTLLYQMNLENLHSDTLETFTSIDEIIKKFNLTNPIPFASQDYDPLPTIVPSTQKTLPSEIIVHIFSFLTSSNLLEAYFVSKLWMGFIKTLMQRELNINAANKIDTNNVMMLDEKNTWPYFFAASRIQLFHTLSLKEKKLKIAEILHKQLILAIEQACETTDSEKIIKILQRAITLNIRLKLQESDTKALHLAAFNGHVECIELLIKTGIQPNTFSSIDNQSNVLTTALKLAVNNFHVKAVFTLLILGARAENLVCIERKSHVVLSSRLTTIPNTEEFTQIQNFVTAKAHIENAEEKLIDSYKNDILKDEIVKADCRKYIKIKFEKSYASSPELFKNLMLSIFGKKHIMYNDDYFDLKGKHRSISSVVVGLFMGDFVAVLDILNKEKSMILQDPELRLTLASWHLTQKNRKQALAYYATAKQLFQNQSPKVLTTEEVAEISKKLDAVEDNKATEAEETSFLSQLAKKFF